MKTNAIAHIRVQGQHFAGILFLLMFLLAACSSDSNSGSSATDTVKAPVQPKVELPDLPVPDFSSEKAFAYVEKQLSFGPRVPNTGSHQACANWLMEEFTAHGAKVISQAALVTAHDGKQLSLQNIIATFQPEKKQRIMLSAHWDTRPYADQDDERQNEPILGANDGGSGVAILLEIARHLGETNPHLGVDLFLWDGEDYGVPDATDSYCLGSQHWARNKHIPNYQAIYGINLDMVGAQNAFFPKEGQSLRYAPSVVERVWDTAARLGYGNYFSMIASEGIIDDHLYLNTLAGIPYIDIIDQPNGKGFFPAWHTHDDDIDVISQETLKAVGQTLLEVIYTEK